MADLSVRWAGLTLKNPIVVGSSSLGNNIEKMIRLEKAGVAAFMTKVISRKEHMPTGQHGYPYRAVVMGNSWVLRGDPRLDLDYAIWLTKEARKRLAVPIIPNFMGHADKVDIWVDNALALQKAGAHALELDLNCPMKLESEMAKGPDGRPRLETRNPLVHHPESVGKVVKALTQVLDIPIIPKLSPIRSGLIPVAEACVKNGARSITMANVLGGDPGVDIYNKGRTLFPHANSVTGGAYLGQYLWPIHTQNLTLLAKALKGTETTISSGGGIFTWEDVVQRIMLGAINVQLCSALYLQGLGVVRKCLNGLETYLDEFGIKSVDELRGSAVSDVRAHGEQGSTVDPCIAQIKKPLECLKCADPCVEKVTADCLAMSMGPHGVPEIDANKCTGCALCFWSCDSDAIEMIRTEKHVDYRVI